MLNKIMTTIRVAKEDVEHYKKIQGGLNLVSLVASVAAHACMSCSTSRSFIHGGLRLPKHPCNNIYFSSTPYICKAYARMGKHACNNK